MEEELKTVQNEEEIKIRIKIEECKVSLRNLGVRRVKTLFELKQTSSGRTTMRPQWKRMRMRRTTRKRRKEDKEGRG